MKTKTKIKISSTVAIICLLVIIVAIILLKTKIFTKDNTNSISPTPIPDLSAQETKTSTPTPQINNNLYTDNENKFSFKIPEKFAYNQKISDFKSSDSADAKINIISSTPDDETENYIKNSSNSTPFMPGKSIARRHSANKPILRGARVNHLLAAEVSCSALVSNQGQTREKMVDICTRLRNHIHSQAVA